jgi:hypothetical protein
MIFYLFKRKTQYRTGERATARFGSQPFFDAKESLKLKAFVGACGWGRCLYWHFWLELNENKM